MERSEVIRWVRRIVLIAVATAIAYLIAVGRGLDWSQPLQLNARYLSDGFFVVGFMMTGMGLLMWASSMGFFDIMSYGVKSLLMLFSLLKTPEEHPSYFDYKMAREAKRGKMKFGMLITGVVYLALSATCLAAYYG